MYYATRSCLQCHVSHQSFAFSTSGSRLPEFASAHLMRRALASSRYERCCERCDWSDAKGAQRISRRRSPGAANGRHRARHLASTLLGRAEVSCQTWQAAELRRCRQLGSRLVSKRGKRQVYQNLRRIDCRQPLVRVTAWRRALWLTLFLVKTELLRPIVVQRM